MVRTRFAPSPTGYLHIGGARTALFAWAYARHHNGKFVLRIEDTDRERSTDASIEAILDGMQWLGLNWDEGPIYQTQRLDRYGELAHKLINEGKAYRCYCSKEELNAMRDAQRAHGEKPRYDGRWRDSKELPPLGISPVIRFKNPLVGDVGWEDLVKGRITIANAELDDLVILRADGVPTYNFGVVVDDIDMNITHVIRGDDHVNNTPRQINIYRALGAVLPKFSHVPMILGTDGERLSKRHGAVSVTQYREQGFLPEALLNYLARLGWSHGDAEQFSLDQFISWFDFEHINLSPARFNSEKLLWLNQQYIREAADDRVAQLTRPFLESKGCNLTDGPSLTSVVALLKARVSTLVELAEAAIYFYRIVEPSDELQRKHYSAFIKPALLDLQRDLETIEWDRITIQRAIKETLTTHQIKMPELAMPLRIMVSGETQSPAVDSVFELLGRNQVLARISAQLKHFPA